MTLEKMADFFSARLQGYEEHMLENIEGADEFYPYTASLLPADEKACLLDLGCGTGLELDDYFRDGGNASVTAIDLSEDMLGELKKKFADKKIDCICESYFDAELGEERFDCAVSVESLHHFDAHRKLELYRRVIRALKKGGRFVLTDYFADSSEQEKELADEYAELCAAQGIAEGELYHFDMPLTVRHECKLLKEAGFTGVKAVKRWCSTCTITASRPE